MGVVPVDRPEMRKGCEGAGDSDDCSGVAQGRYRGQMPGRGRGGPSIWS